MNRRSVLRRLAAAVLGVPLVRELPGIAPVPEPIGGPYDRPKLTINRLKPFATFPAPIEAMETIKTNGHEDMLLVIAGGVGYIVDKQGTVTPL